MTTLRSIRIGDDTPIYLSDLLDERPDEDLVPIEDATITWLVLVTATGEQVADGEMELYDTTPSGAQWRGIVPSEDSENFENEEEYTLVFVVEYEGHVESYGILFAAEARTEATIQRITS